ncbi:hypothetical protein CFP56_035019 [Quercus suber]|uniref:Uncharacterized protein n=1 Tax=Quercus suber TaxID=58331 RepID=A0AAW0JCC1_QUESU
MKNNENQGNVVVVDVLLPREVISIARREVVDVNVANRVMCFKSINREGREIRVGLNLEVIERMKWEQERVGWVGGNDRQVSLKRVEEFEGTDSSSPPTHTSQSIFLQPWSIDKTGDLSQDFTWGAHHQTMELTKPYRAGVYLLPLKNTETLAFEAL